MKVCLVLRNLWSGEEVEVPYLPEDAPILEIEAHHWRAATFAKIWLEVDGRRQQGFTLP